jgi:hypothetical protein
LASTLVGIQKPDGCDARLRFPPASPVRNSEAWRKEPTDHHLSRLCQPSETPSANSSLGYHRNFASMTHTVERVCGVGHQKVRHVPIPRFTPTVGFPDAATKDITRGNRQKENNTARGEPSRVANGDKRYWAYCTQRVRKSKLKLAPPRAESLLARMLPPWASTID